jgi:general secretion pathway protein K
VRARQQRGIALILVLWVIVLLTIIAVGLTATQRTETTLAGNAVGTARFRALADAAVNYAMLNMMVQPVVAPEAQGQGQTPGQAPGTSLLDEEQAANLWVPDGTPHPWSFDGEQLEIAVFNEASRIDLNQAPGELLLNLLIAAEVPQEQADALADAIIDWRDPDNLRSANGAEDSDYEAAGWPYGTKDGPFDSVEELQQVLGMTRALYQVIAPALTVASGSPQVVQDFASPLVLAALQGITVDEARQRIEEQKADALLPQPGGAAPTTPPRALTNRGGPLYRIRVTLRRREDANPTMEVLVRSGGSNTTSATTATSMQPAGQQVSATNAPFRTLWRRYGLIPARPSAASDANAAGS